MFDVIAGQGPHPLGGRSVAPTIVSIAGHGIAVLVFVVVPFFATDQLPMVPTMMAFVADAPVVPPPPPPPPPVDSAKRAATPKAQPASSPAAFAAPIEAPPDIRPEPAYADDSEDVEGGVEGGLAGGTVGGIVGGLTAAPLPLPTPPAVPARAPVRVGGELLAPALIYRVAPMYSDLALRAQIEGIVILEAIVDVDGQVESVRVLRSVKFLDESAIAAVKQWRYKPFTLNGLPTPFVLAVTVSFTIQKD